MTPDALRELVGRDRELATAQRVLTAAGSGRGGLLLITGEAGIGKTRLLTEVTEIARSSGSTVLTGQAIPGGGTYRAISGAIAAPLRRPEIDAAEQLRPFRAALGRLAPGWRGAESLVEAPGADPVVVLGEGLLRLLIEVGAGCGTLLVLEDLHWADADTLALIGYLAGVVGAAPVVIAVSARDDQLLAAPTTGLTYDDLAGLAGVTTVRLGRLDDASVATIATTQASGRRVDDDVVAEVVSRAAGLPVVIEELLVALTEQTAGVTPQTFSGLVRRRFAGLDESARNVLQAAAVLGSEPDWSLLPDVTGQPEPQVLRALGSAADSGLLRRDSGLLRWRHAMVRDAIGAALLPPEQRAIAARAVAATVAAGGQIDDAQLAELLAMAGDSAGSGSVLLRMARRDIDRGALQSAADLIIRATGTASRGAVAAEQVHLLTVAGRQREALDTGLAALDLVVGDEHAELCLRTARAAIVAGRWTAARELVERAGRARDPRSAILLAEAAFGEGDTAAAVELGWSAIEIADAGGQADALCTGLVVVGRCEELRDPAAAGAAFRRAAQHAAEHQLLPLRIEALFGLGRVELTQTADPARLYEVRELALDAGLVDRELSIATLLGEVVLIREGPVAAQVMAGDTAERAGPLGLSGIQAMSEVILGAASGMLGDVARMTDQLAIATARQHIPREVGALALASTAFPALLERDFARADTLFDNGMRQLVEHGSAAPLIYWGGWALLRTSVADDAFAREFVRGSAAGRRRTNRGALAYADAVAAGRAGQRDEAAQFFADGNQLLAGDHWWRRLLRLIVLDAAVADGWGTPVPELRADLAVFERDGPERCARSCRDLLRQAGAPTRRGRGSSTVPPALRAMGVTGREVDVLELVVAGLSNNDIGQRIFLSPRTVESHVASLLGKFGEPDRNRLRERVTADPSLLRR